MDDLEKQRALELAQLNDLSIKLGLSQTREAQATEACTALTAENQRLRDALKLGKFLDDEVDGLLEDVEELTVENAQLQNDVARLTADLERCRADLDEAKRDARLNGEIISKVNDAVNRAGIHCAVYYWEAIDMIAAERDSLRLEAERCRAVCEAVEHDIAVVTQHRATRTSGGQHVGVGGPLAAANPSLLTYLERLVRDLKRALDRGGRGRE